MSALDIIAPDYVWLCVEDQLSGFRADCQELRLWHEAVKLNYDGDDDGVRVHDLHTTAPQGRVKLLSRRWHMVVVYQPRKHFRVFFVSRLNLWHTQEHACS